MRPRAHTSRFRCLPHPTPPPGARQSPPLIGLQLYATNIRSPVPDCDDDRYDANIMHRVVPPTLQQVTVSIDASSCDLAATFSLPIAYVAAHWLTSRTPMELPGFENAVIHDINNSSEIKLRRHPPSPTELASYRDLAVALTRKLEPLVQPQKHNLNRPARPSRARIEQLHAQALAAIGDGAASSTSTISSASAPQTSADPLPVPTAVPRRRAKERCGFSSAATHTHPDLVLSADRKTVSKKAKGLYRCAKPSAPLSAGWNYYVEFHVQKNRDEGGICVGLSSTEAPLNRIVGSSDCSVGFHSSGKVVVRRGEWLPYGRSYGEGDTVGMLVEMPAERASDVSSTESLSTPSGSDNDQTNSATDRTTARTPMCNTPRITYFINGESQGTVPLQDDTFLTQDKDRALLLHATACLYHAESSIEIKCCATEWEYFPSASAVCSGLRATCHRRKSQAISGSSTSSHSKEKRKTTAARDLGGCHSVLTP